ncbi:MAG: CobD/CbiB family protein [Hylemonella sp.]
MSFFSVLFALLLEQARPLSAHNPANTAMRSWVRWLMQSLDAGRLLHGWLSWGLAVIGPALAALLVYWMLQIWLGWPAAVLWNILILYLTLGFRQFSHFFTDIRAALEAGEDDQARELLAQWLNTDLRDLPRREIVRQLIENSVLAAHRHVFGVLAWFSVLAGLGLGPMGAVLYRMAEYVSRINRIPAGQDGQPLSEAVRQSALKAWHLVNWLPARITALGFAVVGSFEDAIEGWRTYQAQFGDNNDGIIIAATAGAVNVRLSPDVAAAPPVDSESFVAPPRAEPEPAHLRSIVGLIWRSVVMWMLLLFLLTLARLLG